jgi:calcineurin-like phosphoesterase family protein
MIDKTEIIATIISEDSVVHLVEYAATMNVVARVIRNMSEDCEEDYTLAALGDIETEANRRYRKEMREIQDALWTRHGATLRLFDVDEDDLHEALMNYAEEVYGEVYERIAS